MDNQSRSASPGGPARPQHRPPSPPTPTPPSPVAFDNRAYQHDDPNHNDSLASNHPQQNGHKEHNGDTKTLEAVNLELINLQPRNGNAKKKDVEVDMNATNPYDEYFVPVNEHRKYMRGEKLYVTADKRCEKGGCKRPVCWTLLGLIVAAVVAVIALAATGVLFANTPTPVEQYNASISSARALGGIGQVHHAHDHAHEHDHGHDHDHSHDHGDHHDHKQDDERQHDHSQHAQPDEKHTDEEKTAIRTSEEEYDHHDIDNNYESTMYVPWVMEGELKIDNEELKTALSRPNGDEYKHFAENFKQALKEAVLGMDAAGENGDEVAVEIVEPRKETDVVTYRIHWKSKLDAEPHNALTPARLKADLDKYLIRHNRMISHYHVAQDGMKVRRVLDLCQINKNDCEYGCEFDESALDFKCTCPQDQMINMMNPYKCIPALEQNMADDTKQKESNVRDLDSNPTSTQTNSEEDTNNTHNSKENVFDWKATNNVVIETTTATDPDLTFSHIFGHESNSQERQNNDNTNFSGEATDVKPEPEPEPSSKPEPEPTSEPEPSSAHDPSSKTEPTPSSEPEHSPTSEPEPSSDVVPSLSDSEPEPSLAAEPEPSSAPESYKPSKLEPSPEPSSQPELEPYSTPEPEPSPVPAPEPSLEPTPEPQSTAKEEKSESEHSSSSNAETVSEPKTTPEPITETSPESESSSITKVAVNRLPEPTNEYLAEMEIMPELTTESKPHTVSVTGLHQILGHEQNTESNTQPSFVRETAMDELNSDTKLIFDSKLALQHDQESKTELPIVEAHSEEEPEKKEEFESKSFESKAISKTIESSKENKPSHEAINIFDDLDAVNEMTTPINDSSDKTTDSSHNFVTTTEKISIPGVHVFSQPSYVAYPEILTVLQQNKAQENKSNLMGSNSDNDWLDYDSNKTNIRGNLNNTESRSFQDISLNNLNAHFSTTEDELSFQIIAKNNEVPSEIDDDDSKTTSAPVVNMADANYLSVASLNKTESNQVNKTSVTINNESKNRTQLDYLVTESSQGLNLQAEDEHLFKTVKGKNTNETHPVEEQTYENNKSTSEQENMGEEQFNENSDITFGFINSLYNRSSKSIDAQNTTNLNAETSNSTAEENTTTVDSDWITESATETNYVKLYNQTKDETSTVSPLEYLMNHDITSDDFEPDYLNNMDETTSNKMADQDVPMYVSHDYNNEELRMKRVNDDLINNTEIPTNTTENIKDTDNFETTTVSEFMYETTEKVPNNSNITISHNPNQTNNSKYTNKTEPAPVWEVTDGEKDAEHLKNSTVQINEEHMNVSAQGTLENTTPVNNFNVTIYEISALNNHSFQMTKQIHSQSSEYDDHETEMNPFLPEIENNKSLVKKLQEGHDLEPTNHNDTQNENNEDHSIPNDRHIHGKANLSTEFLHSNEYTTTGPEATTADVQNVDLKSSGSSGETNKTVYNDSISVNGPPGFINTLPKSENNNSDEVQSISTFLIDTDDLDRERTTAPSPIMIKNNLENDTSSPITDKGTSINEDDNIEFLSVVPITQDNGKLPEKNVKSENILEFNDIRTLDLTN